MMDHFFLAIIHNPKNIANSTQSATQSNDLKILNGSANYSNRQVKELRFSTAMGFTNGA